LRGLPVSTDPNVLVGYGTSDDAGVYRLRADLALVQTVDFFTPIVDDPYDFGRIAATNALSDIYAMGATPLTALNICAFPIEALGTEVLSRILAGGAAVAREAGVAILGGHTIEADEPTYGLSVTGRVHPDRIVRNAGARPGDVLILTKPLGTGILATALKKDAIGEAQMAEAVRWMTTLNAGASKAMIACDVHAATDVTGYGLLGHGHEMARASDVRVTFSASSVPIYSLARELAAIGIAPGGSRNSAREHAAFTDFSREVPDDLRAALRACDALDAIVGAVRAGSGIAVEP